MKKTIKKAQVGKGPIKAKKPLTDMQRDEMGRPVTPKQKKESLKGLQKSVQYKGRPKMKSGGALGMKSVKAGYDKNPGVTRADIIVAGKGQAKKGTKIKKAQGGTLEQRRKIDSARAVSPVNFSLMKKSKQTKPLAKPMKSGGKCRYGCK